MHLIFFKFSLTLFLETRLFFLKEGRERQSIREKCVGYLPVPCRTSLSWLIKTCLNLSDWIAAPQRRKGGRQLIFLMTHTHRLLLLHVVALKTEGMLPLLKLQPFSCRAKEWGSPSATDQSCLSHGHGQGWGVWGCSGWQGHPLERRLSHSSPTGRGGCPVVGCLSPTNRHALSNCPFLLPTPHPPYRKLKL